MENQEEEEEGVCLMSFDGGGPGSLSQLRLLDEFMARLAFELDDEVDEPRPADYFDVMGGVGFGAFIALLLGRLRMSTTQAMDELSRIGTVIFPKGDAPGSPEMNTTTLRKALERMLERHGHSIDIKLRGDSISRCKVVVFAATAAVMDHCQAFRTYRSPRRGIDCTLVEAACAVLAIPEFFSPISIGPRSREQRFAGIPHGFDNPTREVLKEAQLIFGSKKRVSLVLSLGSGQRAVLSDLGHHITRLGHIQFNTVARDLSHQLSGFGAYLRLNVDRGMENIQFDDWHELGLIETYTNVYLEMSEIMRYIDNACQWLLKRNGSVTLGQLDGTSTDLTIKFHSRTLKDYLAMEFKQMHEVVQQMGIEKITLVDAIGNHIPIPKEFCPTYAMLIDVIGVYFRHQKPPGSDFVERGDYRLVHGSNRDIVAALEWTYIEKVGLKVELSIILRTHNEDEAKCPRCHAWSQGHATNGWTQCLSCSGQFQIETETQEENSPQSEEISQPEDENTGGSSLVTPAVMESRSSSRRQTPESGSRNSGHNQELQFRLISVINLLQAMSQQPQPSATADVRAFTAVILGNERSGKSALTLRYTKGYFLEAACLIATLNDSGVTNIYSQYDPTIEETYRQTVTLDGESSILEILDTAGAEQFVSLNELYIKAGHGFILAFSLTDQLTLREVETLREQILRLKGHRAPIVVVGTNSELIEERQVAGEQIRNISLEWGVPIYQVSAKRNWNVTDAFDDLLRQMRARYPLDVAASLPTPIARHGGAIDAIE